MRGPHTQTWDTRAIIIFAIQTSTPPAPSPRRKSVNRNFSLKTWADLVENILNSYPGVWLQIICVFVLCLQHNHSRNMKMQTAEKCKWGISTITTFWILLSTFRFHHNWWWLNVKCICADKHCCTLLHLRVEPVWSLRFEPSSAFALSDRKSNFEVTTKMFICCVPHYWLTGPHPCLHLHPLWAAPVIKGQFSVHPPLHPGSIKSGIIHISQPGICHCVLVHSQLLRELLLITILGPPSPAIIRSTLSWIFRF